MRLVVYLDQGYRSDGTRVYAQRPFVIFLNRLAEEVEEMLLLGRLAHDHGSWPYQLSERIRFEPLPNARGADAVALTRGLRTSLRVLDRALDDVDVAWLLGPQGLCMPFVRRSRQRRIATVLGVRQDLVPYVRGRHPRNPPAVLAASLLERSFAATARRHPVVTVGSQLARRYAHAPRILELEVSLVRDDDIVAPADALSKDYEDDELRVLAVGRLDPEKNPLLLADILAVLRAGDGRWRLTVCGDGPLRAALERRLEALGVRADAELLGHLPLREGLLDRYRESHLLLHVSLTEGVPQVLHEAFALGLPVVATDVGGVGEAAAGAAVLIPPADAEAAADALRLLAADPELRARVVTAGHERVLGQTIDAQCARLSRFLGSVAAARAPGEPPPTRRRETRRPARRGEPGSHAG